MMSNLPPDLVEEILCRVPTKSLKRLRTTCKRWNALFKNRGFTEKHSHKATKQFLVLMLKDCRVRPTSINLNVATSYIEFKVALSLKDFHSNPEQVDIATVFHCDGLLLCTTFDDRLVVWNPCLGETRWIERKIEYKRNSQFALGYQTNKSWRSYKIVRCWETDKDDVVVAFEIYDLSSNSWRVLDNVALDGSILQNTSVSLKGNTYWIASNGETYFLLSFDFTTERSKRLYPLPDHNCLSWMALSVVREEQLSVLIQNFDTSTKKMEMEFWINNNIESKAALLWRKCFTMDLDRLTCFYNSFIIDEEKKMAVCCYIDTYETRGNIVNIIGMDNQYYLEIPLEEVSKNWQHPIILNYVPNLIQI